MAERERMRRLLITGSRGWHDQERMGEALAPYSDGTWVLVHGACRSGADAMADMIWHATWGLPIERHPADWRRGKSAGFRRNEDMVDLGADLVIAFRVAYSNGTTHCANYATMKGIPVVWYTEDEDD